MAENMARKARPSGVVKSSAGKSKTLIVAAASTCFTMCSPSHVYWMGVRVWLTMRYGILVMTILFTALGGEPGRAAYCEGGQQPAPPALAARMALPACGFDATKRWGPNG